MIKRVLDLKAFRERNGIKTQKELAEKLGLPLSSINKYEINGVKNLDLIPLSLLIRLSDRYQVKIDDILTYKQTLDTAHPLCIDKDLFKTIAEKRFSLCNPLTEYWQTVNEADTLNNNQKRFLFYILKNEIRYFCSVYHKPVIGIVSKYNQDSLSLVQMLLGENFESKIDIYDSLKDTKPLLFVYTENEPYIQHYKFRDNQHPFIDINSLDYKDFACDNIELTEFSDRDFSICFLSNKLLTQVSFLKFNYKDSSDEDAYFSEYQYFYDCDILIQCTKSKQEIEETKQNEESKIPSHSNSIYDYKLTMSEAIRKINDIVCKEIVSIEMSAGEDVSKEDFENIKKQLSSKIDSYFDSKKANYFDEWIQNYIQKVNAVLQQLKKDVLPNTNIGEINNEFFEQLPNAFTISNKLTSALFDSDSIDLDKTEKAAKELLESMPQYVNTTESIPSDCTQLKQLFDFIIEFAFGVELSTFKENIVSYYFFLLRVYLREFTDEEKRAKSFFLNYFGLILDVTFSLQLNKSENDFEFTPSDYCMNCGTITNENLIHYISYQILSFYSSKIFEYSDKVKFYHKTDPYIPKVKKIIAKIKNMDIEKDAEVVNKKINNAIESFIYLLRECIENFEKISGSAGIDMDFLDRFISINEKLFCPIKKIDKKPYRMPPSPKLVESAA